MIQFQEIYTVLSVSKLCDVGCLHQHCSRLGAIAWIRKGMLLKFLRILVHSCVLRTGTESLKR